MSTKLPRFFACLMLSVTTSSAAAHDDAPETVDSFARRQLLASEASEPASKGLELVFTQSRGVERSAYLLIDGRFGKEVKRGERLRGWRVERVAVDHIELSKGGVRERVLLGSEIDPLTTTVAADPEHR